VVVYPNLMVSVTHRRVAVASAAFSVLAVMTGSAGWAVDVGLRAVLGRFSYPVRQRVGDQDGGVLAEGGQGVALVGGGS
jgi:hypothetical protein